MEIRTLSDLEQTLKNKIKETMNDEISQTAKTTMQEKIETEVYEKYTPEDYIRTYKLLEAIETKLVNDNTLEVATTRTDEETGKYIPTIIETGKGYTWGYKRDLDKEIGARPYVAETFNALQDGKFKNYLIKGLSKRGIKVK